MYKNYWIFFSLILQGFNCPNFIRFLIVKIIKTRYETVIDEFVMRETSLFGLQMQVEYVNKTYIQQEPGYMFRLKKCFSYYQTSTTRIQKEGDFTNFLVVEAHIRAKCFCRNM